jgi:hypothetical protein
MMRATAPVSFFHFDSSATSCFFAVLDLQQVLRGSLDVPGNPVAMSGTKE